MVAGGNYKTIINCCIGISSVVAPHTDHPLIKDGFATDAILWHLMHINRANTLFIMLCACYFTTMDIPGRNMRRPKPIIKKEGMENSLKYRRIEK